jgi:uncharacterized protein YukE
VPSTGTVPAGKLLPLAPFSYEWVHGDIHGLAAFAGTLYGYAPSFDDVVTALDKKVSQITDDAGWRGKAASAFTQNWEQVSIDIDSVALVTMQTASIVDQLAYQLSKIENALEQAADVTTAHGVPIGSDGQPSAQASTNATEEEWLTAYTSFYGQCMAAAENARIQAAGALQSMTSRVISGNGGGSGGSSLSTKVGEGTTVADILTDLLATKAAEAHQLADKVAELRSAFAKAKQALVDAREAARGPDGRFGKLPEKVRQAYSDASDELDSEKAELAKVTDSEGAFSKLIGTQLRDLPAMRGLAAGLDETGALDKVLKGLLDLPVVDVVAGGVSTYLNAQADIHAGVPAWAAYPLETGGTVASFVAADAAADFVGGAVAGLSVAGAPVLGVVAGTLAAGVVAYGVGDYVHNYIADFSGQWHKYGVLAVFTDQWAALKSTGQDVHQLAHDVWHGITSIF